MNRRPAWLVLLLVLCVAPLASAQRADTPRFAPDAEIRAAFEPILSEVRASVVSLVVDGEKRALGTIVDPAGYLLTKASELGEAGTLAGYLADGRRVQPMLVGVDRLNDLAMLKIDADRLQAVQLVDREPAIGRFVACVGQEKSPTAVGIISSKPREVKPPQLVMGVILQEHPGGLRVVGLSEEFGAAKAGIRSGDLVVRVAGKKVLAVEQAVDRLQGMAEGDVVEVDLLRGSREMSLPVTLSELAPDPESRSERMNRMGGAISERRRGFERVLQHDAEVRPEHCGGPLVNLKGEVVGLNIARAGRIESYALPSGLIKARLERLKSGELLHSNGPVAEPVVDREPEPAR